MCLMFRWLDAAGDPVMSVVAAAATAVFFRPRVTTPALKSP